jgi:hypothetical protein
MNIVKRSLPKVDVIRTTYDAVTKGNVTTTVREDIDLSKRISHRDEFELSYLRWRYLLRTENPAAEVLEKYKKAAYKSAKESYRDHENIYKASGMEPEDVCNIALVHLVSYLGIYSLQYVKEVNAKFSESFAVTVGREPTLAEVAKEDLSNMICFISQRMNDLIRICKQKNRNITGELSATGLFRLVGKEKQGADLNVYFAPASYGYKKVGTEEYKKVKKLMHNNLKPGRFEVDGAVYRFVVEILSPVWFSDYQDTDSLDLFNPQDHLVSEEYVDEFRLRYRREKLLDRYQAATQKSKARMLNRVISILEKRGGYPKEVVLAKQLLDRLK